VQVVRHPFAPLTLGALLLASACGGHGVPASSSSPPAAQNQAPIPVVAAENFYGDVAAQIGGSRVSVTSILSDPSVDPHIYEANVENAKAIGAARLVIKNGVGYDAFMDKLLSSAPRQGRIVIDTGQLMGTPDGANPHLWYQPKTMPKLAQTVADRLSQLDPAGKPDFDAALQKFNSSLTPLDDLIGQIKRQHAGAKVLPTEPVFDYMAEALGLDVADKDGAFQKAVEAGNDPPAEAVAQFRQQLASRTIKALIYNVQAVTPITAAMQAEAKQNGVPVIGVSETEPPGKTYQQWMLDELAAVQRALG
jgi:zinc/manganese transport system substrate-binding protein